MAQSRFEAGGGIAPAVPPALGRREFEELRKLAYGTFGLDLREGKETLVAVRLGRRLRALGCSSYAEYLRILREDRAGEELSQLVDSLTTNFTSFLREPDHFQLLEKKILPCLRGREMVSIWSAGCATGEEPYSILFTALDAMGVGAERRIRVFATDISTRALAQARSGRYPASRCSQLPQHWRTRFWERVPGAAMDMQVRSEYRQLVEFRRFNLMEGMGRLPVFPVIFCRNVMIYFDKATQEKLLNGFATRLEPGGYMLIGHSESLMGVRHPFEYVMPAVYRKPAR